MRTIDTTELSRHLAPLIGLPAWDAKLGVGSMLTVEFGARDTFDAAHGVWHLWITMAAWRWETADAVIAGSEDDRSTIAAAIAGLNGQQLTDITVEHPSLETTFHFSESKLIAFPIYSTSRGTGDLGNWVLWTPEQVVISADPDRGLILEPRAETASGT